MSPLTRLPRDFIQGHSTKGIFCSYIRLKITFCLCPTVSVGLITHIIFVELTCEESLVLKLSLFGTTVSS